MTTAVAPWLVVGSVVNDEGIFNHVPERAHFEGAFDGGTCLQDLGHLIPARI
jgi:hypothetical protein